MRWLTLSWLVGRLGGAEIRLHYSLLFIFPIAFLIFRAADFDRWLLAALWLTGYLLSVFLHELGHAAAARLAGVQVKSIVIWLLGGATRLSREPDRPVQRVLVSGAGPLMTLVLSVLFGMAFVLSAAFLYFDLPSFVLQLTRSLAILSFSLAGLNLILLVFNLLPVYPLDGGQIMHAILVQFFGVTHADWITMVVGIPVLLGMAMLAVVLRDYLLLAFCFLLALAIATLNSHARRWVNLVVNYALKREGYYWLQGDFDRAVEVLTRRIERGPPRTEDYCGRSACYVFMLRFDLALRDVETALSIDSTNLHALLYRGDLHLIAGDDEAALDYAARAQTHHPGSHLPLYVRAIILRDRGDYAGALQEFDKAQGMESPQAAFYIARSIAHFKLGALAAAHSDQDRALNLSERDALVRPDFGMSMYEHNLDWAEDFYGRVLTQRPRSWLAYQGRADAYRTNGDHDRAIADYTCALAIQPREPRLYLGRGQSRHAAGDLSGAAVDFRMIPAVTRKPYLRQRAEQLLNVVNGDA